VSATGRGASSGHERQADDFYRTPAWAVRAILPHLRPGSPKDACVLDPFCGDGAILDVCERWTVAEPGWVPRTVGIEVDHERVQKARCCVGGGHDVLEGDAFQCAWPEASVIVTNPPFKDALPAVQKAIAWSMAGGVTYARDAAFLLRLAFLESEERVAFHKEHPADIYALPKRPAFCASITCKPTKGGCGWHVTQAVEAPRPKVCPGCGGKLDVTTTDMAAYAWWVWGPGRGNRWRMLECE
jgi:hypothetical protein